MDSNSSDKITIDKIAVKNFNSDNVDIIQLQSKTHGVVSGSTLQSALRNLAKSVELSENASKINDLQVNGREGGGMEKITLAQSTDEQSKEKEDREKLSQS